MTTGPVHRESHRIDPAAGYDVGVGYLVSLLASVRRETVDVVSSLSLADLDHHHDRHSNSIGALLAHVAAVECHWQLVVFDDRYPSDAERAAWMPQTVLGEDARRTLRGCGLAGYLEELARVRDRTLSRLAARDDAWLVRTLPLIPDMNALWAWQHVIADEISHRGQIRWLRARLPGAAM